MFDKHIENSTRSRFKKSVKIGTQTLFELQFLNFPKHIQTLTYLIPHVVTYDQ